MNNQQDFQQLLLNLLKDFKEDVNRRFDRIDEELHDLKDEIRDIKRSLQRDEDKLQEVYESREKVKITFGWQWGLISLFIAIIAVTLSQSI